MFTFVSGQIAKSGIDAMTINTPVATIGVRGTEGGGRAGPEGTPNTFSLFGGEMSVSTLGGGPPVIMNQPGQTTQMTSAYVPPTKPVVLHLVVLQSYYAKAAAIGPKPVFQGPAQTGPVPDTPPAQGDADAVIAAAIDVAAEAEIQAALTADPLVFGTPGSIEGVLNQITFSFSGGTGVLPPLTAGTGGPGSVGRWLISR